jgi:hypothetical protein
MTGERKIKMGGKSFAEWGLHGSCQDSPAKFSNRRQRFPVVFLPPEDGPKIQYG